MSLHLADVSPPVCIVQHWPDSILIHGETWRNLEGTQLWNFNAHTMQQEAQAHLGNYRVQATGQRLKKGRLDAMSVIGYGY
jgi:hypothetical protein